MCNKALKTILLFIMFSFMGQVAIVNATEPEVRDPTQPLGNVAAATTLEADKRYELNSLLVSAQRRVAVINGQALHEGQVLAGSGQVRLKKITNNGVMLQQGNKTWELRLSPIKIRKY